MGAFLMAMAMIALENNYRVLAQAKAIHRADQLTDSLIICGDKGGVEIARVGEFLIVL